MHESREPTITDRHPLGPERHPTFQHASTASTNLSAPYEVNDETTMECADISLSTRYQALTKAYLTVFEELHVDVQNKHRAYGQKLLDNLALAVKSEQNAAFSSQERLLYLHIATLEATASSQACDLPPSSFPFDGDIDGLFDETDSRSLSPLSKGTYTALQDGPSFFRRHGGLIVGIVGAASSIAIFGGLFASATLTLPPAAAIAASILLLTLIMALLVQYLNKRADVKEMSYHTI